jgi:RNA polymerase primary sigma factor
MRLVVSIAKRYKGNGLELDELIAEGTIGLIKAIDRYDVEKGTKLSTFSTFWIKKHVIRSIENLGREVRVPHTISEAMWKVVKTRKKLESQGETNSAQIADACDMEEDEVRKLLAIHTSKPESLDNITQHPSVILSEKDWTRSILYRIIDSTLSSLTFQEQNTIRLLFGIGYTRTYTKRTIANYYGITQKNMERIADKAIQKLKNGFPAL